MDVATTSGIVGMATGLGGLIFGWLAWRRAGRALDESRWTPVRQAQHAILDAIADHAKELHALLENDVNLHLQVQDPLPLEVDVAEVRRLVDAVTDKVVADRELDAMLNALKVGTETNQSMHGSFMDELDDFVRLLRRVEAAKGGAADAALQVGSELGARMEPLRRRNYEMTQQLEAIRQRVEHLATYGLGPNPKPVTK